MTLLFTAALIFLPDIGLWSLYKEKHLVKPAEPAEPQVGAKPPGSRCPAPLRGAPLRRAPGGPPPPPPSPSPPPGLSGAPAPAEGSGGGGRRPAAGVRSGERQHMRLSRLRGGERKLWAKS